MRTLFENNMDLEQPDFFLNPYARRRVVTKWAHDHENEFERERNIIYNEDRIPVMVRKRYNARVEESKSLFTLLITMYFRTPSFSFYMSRIGDEPETINHGRTHYPDVAAEGDADHLKGSPIDVMLKHILADTQSIYIPDDMIKDFAEHTAPYYEQWKESDEYTV